MYFIQLITFPCADKGYLIGYLLIERLMDITRSIFVFNYVVLIWCPTSLTVHKESSYVYDEYLTSRQLCNEQAWLIRIPYRVSFDLTQTSLTQ